MPLRFFQPVWMGIWEERRLGPVALSSTPVAPRTMLRQTDGRWRPGFELGMGVPRCLQGCPSAQPTEEGGRDDGDVPAAAKCLGWLGSAS